MPKNVVSIQSELAKKGSMTTLFPIEAAVSAACSNVSVVIPLYNKKRTILRAIESVMRELLPGDQVIVVDDGSTDGSAEEVRKRFSNVTSLWLVSQKNQGVSVARNRGVEESIHPYVVFLDADDWWLTGFRARIAELVRQWPCAMAWSVGHYRVDGARQVVIDSGLAKVKLMQGHEFIRQYGKFSGLINSSSVCVKKNALASFGGFPVGVTSGEDIYVWLRLALLGEIAVCPEALVAVERPLFISEVDKGRDKVGYHYRFFGESNVCDRLTREQYSAIKGFMMGNGLRQVAGLIGAGKRGEGFSCAAAIARIVPRFWLLALPMLLLPKAAYVYAYNKRHAL